MIGPILAVTMTVGDLKPIESAYSQYLGYKVVERGKVDAASAAVWGAPLVAGHDFIVMQPESGAPHYLRFVVTAPYPDYEPFRTYGWNSTELLVSDVDQLAGRLRSSPFQIVGEPRNLSTTDDIKAMQVMGPAREFLYLTTIKDPKHPLGQAKSFVDRMFIVINGGRDMDALLKFYGEVLGAATTAPIPVRMSALNKIHGLDSETKHPLATAKLNGPFMVELDQYPAGVKDRHVRSGDLPPGTAMVTVATPSIAAIKAAPVAPAARLKGLIAGGSRAAVIKGPSGELLELVERP
jgi:hypothetical protein